MAVDVYIFYTEFMMGVGELTLSEVLVFVADFPAGIVHRHRWIEEDRFRNIVLDNIDSQRKGHFLFAVRFLKK